MERRITLWNKEIQTFREVSSRANNFCEITWEYIYNTYARCFAYILSKKKYPEHCCNSHNIIFVKNIKIHQIVDSVISVNEFELYEMLNKWLSLIPIVQQLVRRINLEYKKHYLHSKQARYWIHSVF